MLCQARISCSQESLSNLYFLPLSVFPKDCQAKLGLSSPEFASISGKFECCLWRSSLTSEKISVISCLSFLAPATVGALEMKSSTYIFFNASLTVSGRSDLNDSPGQEWGRS